MFEKKNLPNYTSHQPSVRGCLVFLLFCVFLVEGLIGRTGITYRLVPDAAMETLLRIEELVIKPNPHPKVVVMGTSRGRGSFLPTVLEENLGLQRGEVLNLAMGGGEINDALWTYQRNRATLSKAKWVIVQADPFQFTTGFDPAYRFREMANLEDRLAYSGRRRLRLLLNMGYKTDLALPYVTDFVSIVYGTRAWPQKKGLDPYGRIAYVSLEDDHEDREFTEERLVYWITQFYTDYEHSPVFESRFLQLAQMVHEDGGQVVVFGQPTVDAYLPLLRREKGPLFENFRARMELLASQHGFETLFWSRQDAGLAEQDFRDWGHLNITGARKFSSVFAAWLGPRMREGKPMLATGEAAHR